MAKQGVSWEVVDLSGTMVYFLVGNPFTGTLCFPQIFGCTDPCMANNYDPISLTLARRFLCLFTTMDVQTQLGAEL